jgi:hypothetical protein
MIRRAIVSRVANIGMAPLVICERKGRWAADWRRLAASQGEGWPRIRLVEVRTAADCLSELDRAPAAFVLLECTEESLAARLRLLDQIDRQYPEAICAAAVERVGEAWHALLREFGAVHVVGSPLGLLELARMMGRRGACGEPPDEPLRERIWARLPWPEAAGRRGGGVSRPT